MKKTLISLYSLVLLASCENDLNIVADWKDIPVVYGIINSQEPINYIKLNKAFLGQGNVMTMAQEFDSLYYNPDVVELRLIEFVRSGNQYSVIDSIYMEPVYEIVKPEGIFSSPNQIIYQTSYPIDYNKFYSIEVYSKNSNSVIASNFVPVDILKPLSISAPNPFTPLNIVPDSYVSKVEWTSLEGAKLYELKVRFYYVEQQITNLSDVTEKYIDWNFPYKISTSIDGGENMTINIEPIQFLNFLAANIEFDPNVYRQVRGVQAIQSNNGLISITHSCFDFTLLAAGEDLSTYISLNQNSGSIVVDRPEYTNITNVDGEKYAGIFSSRSISIIYDIRMNNFSNDEIAFNEITKHLNFAYFRIQNTETEIDTLYFN